MKYPVLIISLLSATLLLAGCDGGPMGGMMHGGSLPQAYRQLSNPLQLTEAHLKAGAELYASNCLVCHGASGKGDGPAGVALNPAPANLRHTMWMPMTSDAYLNWRIAEGGAPYGSAMPAYKQTMSASQRWQLIHYLRQRL